MSNTEGNSLDMPSGLKEWVDDARHALTKGVLTGQLAGEFFDLFIASPFRRRLLEWMRRIGRKVIELENEMAGLSVETLYENDVFVSMVLHASRIASCTHQEEKLEALQNAVLNTALPNAPDEDLQFMFLSFIDTLTPSHLVMLSLSNGTGGGQRMAGPDWQKALDNAFPKLADNLAFYRQVIKDLDAKGLVDEHDILYADVGEHPWPPEITDMGREFIEFITSPLDNGQGRDL